MNWIAVQLRYKSPAARLELVTRHLKALAAGSTLWFFADVPDVFDVNRNELLEVSLHPAHGGIAQSEEFHRSLEVLRSERLVESAWMVDEPLVLRRELLPVPVVPMFYARALAVGSVRAIALLRGAIEAGFVELGDEIVATEILGIYRSLLPDWQDRANALGAYADWLERTLKRRLHSRDGVADLDEGPRLDLADSAPERHWLTHPSTEDTYAPIRQEVADEMLATTTFVAMQGISSTTTALSIRAELLARLAHTHVVRLWGPLDPRALIRETAIVRQLVLAERNHVSSLEVGATD